MKINGNLEVQGVADIRLRKLYEEVPDGFKKAGKIFVNEQNRLCIIDENLEIVEFSSLDDSDYSAFLGDLITRFKTLNSSKINQELKCSLKNDSTLYDLFVVFFKSLKDIDARLLYTLQRETGLSKDKPILRFNADSGKLEACVEEKEEHISRESSHNSRSVIQVLSEERKRVHSIRHDTGNRFCIVQIINAQSGTLLSSASYEIDFTDSDRFVVKLNSDQPIIALII